MRLFFTLCIIFFSHVAFANDNAFLVKDVQIYAEADNLDNARREGLNDGIRRSFEEVVKRLLPVSLHWKLSQIRKEKAYDMLETYKITDERMTSTSYRATIDIIFNKDEMTKHLNFLGAKYATKYSPYYLVVPNLYKKNESLKDEVWDNSWQSAPEEFGLMQFKYMINDLEDFYALSRINSKKLAYEDFAGMLEKYEAQKVLYVNSNIKSHFIDNELVLIGDDGIEQLKYSFQLDDETSDAKNYANMIEKLYELLDERYKGSDKFETKEQLRSQLVINVKNAEEWAEIREKIEFISGVEDIEVVKMNKKQVTFDLLYSVDPIYLSQNLEGDNFQIYEEGEMQFLKLRTNEVGSAQ